MAGGVKKYLYGCVGLLTPECAACLYVYVSVCNNKSEFQQKATLCIRPQQT